MSVDRSQKRWSEVEGQRHMWRVRRVLAAMVIGVAWTAAVGAVRTSSAADSRDSSSIHLLPGLETQVEFWKGIFATYSTHEVVIHDTAHLDRVYEVLDFGTLAEGGLSDAEVAAYAKDKVREEKERVRGMLLRLHQLGPGAAELTGEERKIGAMFSHATEPFPYLEAAAEDRIRAQWGLRERFAGGVEVSRRYLPEMEAIFRHAGLPWELTRLPLVESCFNIRAYSKVGAAGVWQFMPSTGRLYMRVDNAVDERRDPIVSTRAAAEHLRANYDVLGSWPLAVTAYNHGRAGMVHAVAAVGSSDLVDIVRSYNGPGFKFASRNFYAEFLAALDVEQHFDEYFGPLRAHQPLRAQTVIVPDATGLRALASAANTDVDTLTDLNPALSPAVVTGRVPVPRGYELRVPPGGAAGFATRYASLPRPAAHAHAAKGAAHHARVTVAAKKHHRATVAATRHRKGSAKVTRVRARQRPVVPPDREA